MDEENGSKKFTRDALAMTSGLAAGQLALAGLTKAGWASRQAFGSPLHVVKSAAAFAVVLATGLGVATLTDRALSADIHDDNRSR